MVAEPVGPDDNAEKLSLLIMYYSDANLKSHSVEISWFFLILREINFDKSTYVEVLNVPFITHFEALDCDFHEFLVFTLSEYYKRFYVKSILENPEVLKMTFLAILGAQKFVD